MKESYCDVSEAEVFWGLYSGLWALSFAEIGQGCGNCLWSTSGGTGASSMCQLAGPTSSQTSWVKVLSKFRWVSWHYLALYFKIVFWFFPLYQLNTIYEKFKKKNYSPGQERQSVEVSSCTPEGCGFDSWSGNGPRL